MNERRRLLLSICDAIQCGKTGNKIKMKMTHSMSSLSVLLAGQMWMPELGVLFMVGNKLNNLNFHAIPNCVDYSLNETLIYIVSLYDNRLNPWEVEYFRKYNSIPIKNNNKLFYYKLGNYLKNNYFYVCI